MIVHLVYSLYYFQNPLVRGLLPLSTRFRKDTLVDPHSQFRGRGYNSRKGTSNSHWKSFEGGSRGNPRPQMRIRGPPRLVLVVFLEPKISLKRMPLALYFSLFRLEKEVFLPEQAISRDIT
jgi:hypothetical protein